MPKHIISNRALRKLQVIANDGSVLGWGGRRYDYGIVGVTVVKAGVACGICFENCPDTFVFKPMFVMHMDIITLDEVKLKNPWIFTQD